MQINLRIAVWNANGISRKYNEIEHFLKTKHIDIFLISETHMNKKSHFKIRGYDLITANHPDERCHAGSAVLIKRTIKYELAEEIREPHVQAAGVKVKCNNNIISIYSIYIPPRHNIKCQDFENLFRQFGNRFLVAGDFNSKHPWWGSRLANPKGRELYKCIVKHRLSTLSAGRPTYWPSDCNKIPDLLDFAVSKGISRTSLDIVNNDDLDSDHSALIINLNAVVKLVDENIKLLSLKSDLKYFSYWLEENLSLNISIKTSEELEDSVENFTNLVHESAYLSQPSATPNVSNGSGVNVSQEIRDLIRNKRRLRRIWQHSRNPRDKANLNLATKLVKERLSEYKNKEIENFLKKLQVNTSKSEHNLWMATRYLKRPASRNIPIKDVNGLWKRTDKDKAIAFSKHLEDTFKPFQFNHNDTEIMSFLDVACQMELPIKHFSPREIRQEVAKLNNKKSPGYDKIDSFVLKNLPKKGIVFLALLFNSILRLQHFPIQWKCAEIIMIHKANKPENCVTSYRPISLLSTFSKLFERLFLKRLLPILEENSIIPDHQFGFRHKHGTPEQCHRLVNEISGALEGKKYCSAVFLDIQQAFDRVWHCGLLYKIKRLLPAPYYLILKSFLSERHFYVKVNNEISTYCKIEAGIPQGSVLGPMLYTIYTSDMPCMDNVTVATYADDTAFLATSSTTIEASSLIQDQINTLQTWLNYWNIKVNEQKSTHVTFSLRRDDCPAIVMNGSQIPKSNHVKYLGMHLDSRLTWNTHIKSKRSYLDIKVKKMFWLLGSKSELSLENKLLLYKSILKPIWTYGVQLWGTASNSNIEILQRFQSKTLRMIVNAPWYITNKAIHRDLGVPFIREEINDFSSRYLQRLSDHINPLAISLLDDSLAIRRLKRVHVLDLPFR